jgi:hypothetical protein
LKIPDGVVPARELNSHKDFARPLDFMVHYG